MKTIFSLLFLLLSFQQLSAQNLSGRWKGIYSNKPTGDEGYVLLVFKLKIDSSYEIYSYTPFLKDNKIDTMLTTKVDFKKVRKNYFLLQETSAEEPNAFYLQTMHLKYIKKKGKEILQGNWESGNFKAPQYGFIKFIKVDDWKEEISLY